MLAMAIYAILLVLLIVLFMPESPRFLMSMEYDDQVKKLIKRIATVNGKVCDAQEILKQEIEFENVEKSKNHQEDDVIIHQKHTAKQEISFISQRRNIIKIASFVYIWFALTLTYYGVGLGKFT